MRPVVRPAVLVVAAGAFALTACSTASRASSARSDATAVPTDATVVAEASTTTTTSTPAAPLAGRVIVIDPGHDGGNAAHSTDIAQQVFIGTGWKECDTSGTASYAGYAEHAHNWDVAQRLATILRNSGATVVLTRPDDAGWGPCITERARIGNDAHADLAVSIHADGGPDDGRGFHVLYPAPVTPESSAIAAESARLALAIRDAYARATGMPYSTYLGSAGLMARGDLGGLNLSTVPKVFVEGGNMRSAVDAPLLADPGFRQAEAEGIAAGILAHLAGR